MDTFKCVTQRWDTIYGMGSVALEGAYELRRNGNSRGARQQANIAGELLGRLADNLVHGIEVMHDEARHLAEVPAVEPAEPGDFRSPSVYWTISVSRILHQVTFSERSRYFNKLRTLDRTVEVLSLEFEHTMDVLDRSGSQQDDPIWDGLNRLHYDLNTCLRECEVVLKCFLRAVSPEIAPEIVGKLEALPPRRTRPVRQHEEVSV